MSQPIWPIAKSYMNQDGPKRPTAIYSPLGLAYPTEKMNMTADCLEN